MRLSGEVATSCSNKLAGADVFLGAVARPAGCTSVAAGQAVTTSLSSMAPEEGLRLQRPRF